MLFAKVFLQADMIVNTNKKDTLAERRPRRHCCILVPVMLLFDKL